MDKNDKKNKPERPKGPNIFGLLKPYKASIIVLVVLAILSNGINLYLPKIISHSIDNFIRGHVVLKHIALEFFLFSLAIFVFTYLQTLVQTYASERVAKDMREKLSAKISKQSAAYIQDVTSAKLLTNLTSDIDSIKLFVSQAIVSIVSSIFLIIGSSVLLLLINWKLALAVLTVIPLIGGTFFFTLSKVRVYFVKGREIIDKLNKVINESILGSGLIRVLNSQKPEYTKFLSANGDAKDLGMKILGLFASLIPTITFFANIATLIILLLGGHYVINGSMSLGDFAAFSSYLVILIFPILIIGFMSNVIAQASASYQRINEVLENVETPETGTIKNEIKGDIDLQNIVVKYGEKEALKDVSLSIKAHTKTAIIGPTAAGKTQLLYLLTALMRPTSGTVKYDGQDINDYDKDQLHKQIGFVFQDSVIFNITLRENIAFSDTVTDQSLEKAIKTAELTDFINSLPKGLDTIVSERGTSLSGGQKQRIMLARALAINPKVLLLDDFTARVDAQTELSILKNVTENYPEITLVSVTQKIAAVEHYEKIILLMEGEVIAEGTHAELLDSSPEYVQIYNSQRSTSHYELQS